MALASLRAGIEAEQGTVQRPGMSAVDQIVDGSVINVDLNAYKQLVGFTQGASSRCRWEGRQGQSKVGMWVLWARPSSSWWSTTALQCVALA